MIKTNNFPVRVPFVLGLVILLSVGISNQSFGASDEEVNRVGNNGIMLINQGKMDEGLAELKRATLMDPKQPAWHMDYGSFLFEKGKMLKRSGRESDAKRNFDEAEKELDEAVNYLKKKEEAPPKAQCLYLMGEIEFFVRKDMDKSKAYYEKALQSVPNHRGAMDGLSQWAAATATGMTQPSQSAKPAAQNPAKVETTPPIPVAEKPKANDESDKITLNSGQVALGKIVERDAKGLWFEMGAGSKVYFSNGELKSVNGTAIAAVKKSQ